MVFCSPQTLPNGDVRDVVTEYRDPQGPDPQHLVNPLDVHNTSRVNEVENVHMHHVVPISGVNGAGMPNDEDSMVQKTLLALMADVNNQQH